MVALNLMEVEEDLDVWEEEDRLVGAFVLAVASVLV